MANEDKEPAQNFNDEELANIMKEIEGLEQEFTGDAPAAAASSPATENPVTPSTAQKIETVESTDNIIPLARTVEEKTSTTSTASTAMQFKVSGEMVIDLKFSVGDETVEILVDGLTGLTIQLQGGAQFLLPMNSLAGKRQAG